MNFKKIEALYQMVLSNVFINKYNLNLRRINDADINELVNEGIIRPIGEDNYEFMHARGLYEYGIKLLSSKQGGYAFFCFDKAYHIDNNDRDVCLQYITELVRKNEFSKALEALEDMMNKFSSGYEKEDNLYLYLFNLLGKLDEDDSMVVKHFSYDDLLYKDNIEHYEDNEIRKYIVMSKYLYACSLLNDKLSSMDEYSASGMLIKVLLSNVVKADKEYKRDLFNNAVNENYEEIIETIRMRKKSRYITKWEISILSLCETIVDGEKEKCIHYKDYKAKDAIRVVYDAIAVHDYKLALEINDEFIEYRNADRDSDVLNILLTKINDMIEVFENNKLDNEEKYFVQEEELVYVENNDEVTDNIPKENMSYMDSLIKDAEEWAEYISGLDCGIDQGIKKTNLLIKFSLMVRLVFARDFYLQGNIEMGDKYLLQVENYYETDCYVLSFLEDVKRIRDSKRYTRKLVK